jgi:hypothetical protein
MKSPSSPKTNGNSSNLDLQSLRLPANYGATMGVKKLLTNVPVRKPRKPQFFRTHPSADMAFDGMLLQQKEKEESYLVVPGVAQQISELVQPVDLYAAIDRNNNVFLIPVPMPGESGVRNPWHESLFQAVEHSKQNWIRINANMHMGGYDVFEAQISLSEPDWPDHTIDNLVEVAFRGKIIQSLDHPVVQSLLGRV